MLHYTLNMTITISTCIYSNLPCLGNGTIVRRIRRQEGAARREQTQISIERLYGASRRSSSRHVMHAAATNVFWSIGKSVIQYRKELRCNERLVWYCDWSCSALCESAVVKSTSNLANDPIKSLKKIVSCYRAAGYDTPLMRLDCWEIQSLGRESVSAERTFPQVKHLTSLFYLLVRHRALYVLLVGEDKQGCT
jgi:hypothetical protein